MPSIRRSYSTSTPSSSSSSDIKLANYSITYNALNKGHTPTETADSRKAHDLAKTKGTQVLPKLLKYIEQYPHMPEFMNYLAMYYINSKNEAKSFEVTIQTAERFPNYLFGKTNLALMYLKQKEYEKVLTVIDESFDVKKVSPERDLFHISEVRSMALVAIQYFDETEQLEKADVYLEYLKITLPKNEEIVGHLERNISMARLRIGLNRLANYKEDIREVEDKAIVVYPEMEDKPDFVHPEIENLYQFSLEDIPHSVLEAIVALPRESVINDLKKVLIDTIQRYDWYSENYEEFEASEQSFPIHALRLLGALRAEEALTEVLHLIGQEEELLDYWFSDALFGEFESIYFIAQHQIPTLKAFLMHRNINTPGKELVGKVLTQIVHHDLDRRAEILTVYEEIFDYFIQNAEDEDLIDTVFAGAAICGLIEVKAVELLPTIQKLYEHGIKDDILLGSYEEVEKDMNKEYDEAYRSPLPTSIVDHYTGEYHKKKVAFKVKDSGVNFSDALKNLLSNRNVEDDDDYSYYQAPKKEVKTLTFKTVPKNSPCSCGSGRKYKNCHGKK